MDKDYDAQNGIELNSLKNLSYANLNELIFRNNGMKILNDRLLNIFPYIKILDLSQNEIEQLKENTFHSPQASHLVELHLERNQIQSIDKYIFSSLHNLKYLNLKENRIIFLEDLALKSLSKLELLDLSRNKITTLTEQTFEGLDSLQDLTISYNPLKNIASSSFEYLGNHSPLKRLEMVSNTDSDWFVFDDSDICMLVFFKCGVQIQIDHDQTCNCFVKYSNLIGHEDKDTNNADDWSISEKNLFKPCTIETKFTNKQEYRYENEEKDLPKIECPKSLLQNCYPKKSYYPDEEKSNKFNNSSCLFNKIIESNSFSKKKSLEYTSSLSFTDKVNVESMTDQRDINQKKEAPEQKEFSIKQPESKQKNSTEFFGKIEITLEEKLKFILIGLTIFSIISVFSLSIACYLLCKSKRIQYHRAETDLSNK